MPINPIDRHAIAPAMCAARQESTCSPYPAALCGDVDQSVSGARLSEAQTWSEEEKKGGDICVPFLSASLWRRSLCGLGA